MKHVCQLLVAVAFLSEARAQDVKRNIPYAKPAHERQVLDVYSPKNAKNLPVVFWIHGGGWQTGDKANVQRKPQAFTDKGFVFVSTNYRLLPGVDMATIVRDIAKSVRWVHEHIAEYGGDPGFLVVSGGSAGGHLAALAALTPDDPAYQPGFEDVDTSVDACVPIYGVYDFLNRDGLRGEAFTRYLLERRAYYAAETRWPDSAFWRRRTEERMRDEG